MGVIVDTSTLVSAERGRLSVGQIFEQLRGLLGDQPVGISAVTLVELAHGVERAQLEIHRVRAQQFLSDLTTDIRIYPVTATIAQQAGQISGQQARKGIQVPFEDLLIGATALNLGFAVATGNTRHFEMIPDLVLHKL